MSKNKNFSDTAASRYSLALYELAEESKHVKEIEDQSSALIKLVDESKDFESLVKNPINKKEDQINVMNKICMKYIGVIPYEELERCKSLGCFLFVVVEVAFGDMWAVNARGYKKFRLDYVYHRMREIQAKYSDCCQFVFSGSRRDSEELIPKILVLGTKLWDVDLQYFWDKQINKNGLGDRKTKTKKTVRRYKPTASRKRGIYG